MQKNGFWVFGYGSLVWQPEFEYQERQIARLEGYARSFCMRSIHHRGTAENPGLVLALDHADSYCDGVAFFVGPDHAQVTLDALRERELVSSAYLETVQQVALRDGRRAEAVSYVIDRDHVQYCHLPLEEQAQIIAVAEGGRGSNVDYLVNTASHLKELGLEDPDLTWLSRRVAEIRSASGLG
jgi:cation transport protein ChaC